MPPMLSGSAFRKTWRRFASGFFPTQRRSAHRMVSNTSILQGKLDFLGQKVHAGSLRLGCLEREAFLKLSPSYGHRGWCLAIVAAPYFHSGLDLLVLLDDLSPAAGPVLAHSGRAAGTCIRCTSISLGFLAGCLLLRTPNVRWLKYRDRNYRNGMASRRHGHRFRNTAGPVRSRCWVQARRPSFVQASKRCSSGE